MKQKKFFSTLLIIAILCIFAYKCLTEETAQPEVDQPEVAQEQVKEQNSIQPDAKEANIVQDEAKIANNVPDKDKDANVQAAEAPEAPKQAEEAPKQAEEAPKQAEEAPKQAEKEAPTAPTIAPPQKADAKTKAEPFTLRIMTANTTSGEEQSYDEGEGIRFIRALRPDIVLIQEFNYSKGMDAFVKAAFDGVFHVYRGKGRIPNGVISRYPIVESGGWKSNRVSDRQWEWSVIDIPGEPDLLAISVHLYTQDNAAEMGPLLNNIQNKMAKDGKKYYVILGGDFNQTDWNVVRKNLAPFFDVGQKYKDWPQDQEGMTKTNATRHKQIDYLLCSPDLCRTEIPVVIGKHQYPRGHVLDSRVYEKLGELNDIKPVKAGDSAAKNMQHMAVIRDFRIAN